MNENVTKKSLVGIVIYSWPLRFVSFFSAAIASLAILIFPQWVASSVIALNHSALSLCLWGISAAFVHGVGYEPKLLVWRVLLGPWMGVPVILLTVSTWDLLR